MMPRFRHAALMTLAVLAFASAATGDASAAARRGGHFVGGYGPHHRGGHEVGGRRVHHPIRALLRRL